jgi:hypothetical protein
VWIAASLLQGIIWFAFFSININDGFSEYTSKILLTSLLVSVIHGAGTGVVLNWILSDPGLKTV